MVMNSVTIDQLMEDYGPNNLKVLADSVKHLTFEIPDGTYHKVQFFTKNPVDRETFEDKDGRRISVADHWNNKLRRPLKNSRLPGVVRTGSGNITYPAEVCRLVPGQRPKTDKPAHQAALIRASAKPAPERLQTIQSMIADQELYDHRTLDKEFGFKIDCTPMRGEATVLDPPVIHDGNNREIKVSCSNSVALIVVTKNVL